MVNYISNIKENTNNNKILGMAEVGNHHPLRTPTYGINLPTPTMRRAQRNQIRRNCL